MVAIKNHSTETLKQVGIKKSKVFPRDIPKQQQNQQQQSPWRQKTTNTFIIDLEAVNFNVSPGVGKNDNVDENYVLAFTDWIRTKQLSDSFTEVFLVYA